MNLSNRKTPRANWHKYNGGEYFVTICTKDRIHYFGEIADGKIHLTDIGEYLKTQIENVTSHYPYAKILLSTIMPNHIHLIVSIDNNKTPYDRTSVGTRRATSIQSDRTLSFDENARTPHATSLQLSVDQPNENVKNDVMRDVANRQGWLSVCIGGIKSSVTRFANECNIPFKWQKRYHDHIIQNQRELNRIAGYIENNPMIWHRDRNN